MPKGIEGIIQDRLDRDDYQDSLYEHQEGEPRMIFETETLPDKSKDGEEDE